MDRDIQVLEHRMQKMSSKLEEKRNRKLAQKPISLKHIRIPQEDYQRLIDGTHPILQN